MKFILDNWMLITLALISGALLLAPVLQEASSGGLSANDAVLLINREKAVVVDVCEPAEFAAGHIVGSKNIPLADLSSKLGAAAKNKGLPLILVCQSGARSAQAWRIFSCTTRDSLSSACGNFTAQGTFE